MQRRLQKLALGDGFHHRIDIDGVDAPHDGFTRGVAGQGEAGRADHQQLRRLRFAPGVLGLADVGERGFTGRHVNAGRAAAAEQQHALRAVVRVFRDDTEALVLAVERVAGLLRRRDPRHGDHQRGDAGECRGRAPQVPTSHGQRRAGAGEQRAHDDGRVAHAEMREEPDRSSDAAEHGADG